MLPKQKVSETLVGDSSSSISSPNLVDVLMPLDSLVTSATSLAISSGSNIKPSERSVVPSTRVISGQMGVFKPSPKYALEVTTSEVTPPKLVKAALADPRWKKVTKEEYEALMKYETWSLVP